MALCVGMPSRTLRVLRSGPRTTQSVGRAVPAQSGGVPGSLKSHFGAEVSAPSDCWYPSSYGVGAETLAPTAIAGKQGVSMAGGHHPQSVGTRLSLDNFPHGMVIGSAARLQERDEVGKFPG